MLGAGVAKALLGKDVLPDDLPYVTGSIGLLGTRPSYEMMMDCDTLLIVGANFPYTQFMPAFGQARAVQIDIDGAMIGMRYPTEVNLVGDAASTLRALLPLLKREVGPVLAREPWSGTSHPGGRPWRPRRWSRRTRSTRCGSSGSSPPGCPTNVIVSADSGSSANWYARHLKFTGAMRGSLSGNLATMGPGVPYAIGAKFAHPDRPASPWSVTAPCR